MKIECTAFKEGSSIPVRYSHFGDNYSPPLLFREVPPEARSLTLIVDDPDAPHGTFTHWIVFNLDPATEGMKENCRVPEARLGNNDWQEMGYGGPRPPDGEHRYFFRLYALDRKLDLPNGATRADIDRAQEGHVIVETRLMGRFATPAPAQGKSG